MDVFISWSGDRSHAAATAIKRWLENTIQTVSAFVSSSDIAVGKRWLPEISEKLQAAHFGIVCLTRSNLQAPWIHFEAGALSKYVKHDRLVPVLLGLTTADLRDPLAQFQAIPAERGQMFQLARNINQALDVPLDEGRLQNAFDAFWPGLQESLSNVLSGDFDDEAAEGEKKTRSVQSMMEETLTLVRGIWQQQHEKLAAQQVRDRQQMLARLLQNPDLFRGHSGWGRLTETLFGDLISDEDAVALRDAPNTHVFRLNLPPNVGEDGLVAEIKQKVPGITTAYTQERFGTKSLTVIFDGDLPQDELSALKRAVRDAIAAAGKKT